MSRPAVMRPGCSRTIAVIPSSKPCPSKLATLAHYEIDKKQMHAQPMESRDAHERATEHGDERKHGSPAAKPTKPWTPVQ